MADSGGRVRRLPAPALVVPKVRLDASLHLCSRSRRLVTEKAVLKLCLGQRHLLAGAHCQEPTKPLGTSRDAMFPLFLSLCLAFGLVSLHSLTLSLNLLHIFLSRPFLFISPHIRFLTAEISDVGLIEEACVTSPPQA